MKLVMIKQCCENCYYWNAEKKRNYGGKTNPYYYAACMYPLEDLKLPNCLEQESTSEDEGSNCACFLTKHQTS